MSARHPPPRGESPRGEPPRKSSSRTIDLTSNAMNRRRAGRLSLLPAGARPAGRAPCVMATATTRRLPLLRRAPARGWRRRHRPRQGRPLPLRRRALARTCGRAKTTSRPGPSLADDLPSLVDGNDGDLHRRSPRGGAAPRAAASGASGCSPARSTRSTGASRSRSRRACRAPGVSTGGAELEAIVRLRPAAPLHALAPAAPPACCIPKTTSDRQRSRSAAICWVTGL